ncbi:hypothetical protein PHMEG_0005583 [Phytophthora megakarya]|uniref:Retrotransposon gag domain-containing protein n=1 Tax=Phytophthora megakarya TaxID=4795 RepID=A0A225WR20_9STRA|nr:hypothetical protein PHMEG_0005583 [Phytophthora megakarya]
MVKQVIYSTLDELHAALVAEFVPPDQQFRLRAELRQCVQYGSVDDYVKDFRRLTAQIHGIHPLDQVDHFCEGLKSETKMEVMYLRCGTLASAIAAAQAYKRTHFAARHATQALPPQGVASPATETPTPMDRSVMDGRRIDKRQCREQNLCFYCKKGGSYCQQSAQKQPGAEKWRGSADVSGVSVDPTTEESPTTSDTFSIEIMELSTVSVDSSTPFIKTVAKANKKCRMLIGSGASHCILKDGVMDTSHMKIIQVAARGFDGGTQQRLVPSCELNVDCDSVIARVPFIFWPMTDDYDGILGRPWLEQCNPVIGPINRSHSSKRRPARQRATSYPGAC